MSCLIALSLDHQLLNAMHVILTRHPQTKMRAECHLIVISLSRIECLLMHPNTPVAEVRPSPLVLVLDEVAESGDVGGLSTINASLVDTCPGAASCLV